MPSSCPIDYYKYHLFGSIVKMKKKQQCSGLSATSLDEFVRIFNSSKLYIYIILFYSLFFKISIILLSLLLLGMVSFLSLFFISTTIKKQLV